MTGDARRPIGLAALEASAAGFVLVCVSYGAVYHLAVASPLRPGRLPVFLWLWGSLALPVWFARIPVRLSGESASGDWAEIGRVASFLLRFSTLVAIVGSGWGLCRPLLWVFAVIPSLVLADLAIRLDAEPVGRPARRAVAVTCAILVACLPLTAWPLRLTTALSRPSLEALAAEVAAGAPVQSPRRAGVLLIQGSSLRGGVPFLLTAPHPAGLGGLTPCPPDRLGRRFNLWSDTPVGGGWRLVFED